MGIIIIIIIKHLYSAMVPGNPVQRRCYKQKIKIKEKYKKTYNIKEKCIKKIKKQTNIKTYISINKAKQIIKT